jgi:DNA-binding LacI/PurR family transcriptional regulator
MLHTWHPATNVQQPDDPLERTIIHHLVDRQVDGIILRPGSEEYEASYFAEIWQHGMPLILIDREMRMFAADFVGTDDVAVGAEAARLLTTLGHRRLLFTGGGENVSTSRWREQGFRHVLSELPDAACRSITLGPGDDDVTRLTGILAAADRPTAVFCYNDTNALPLYAAARQARLRIPQDLSVVGCGAVHCGALLDPPLTTFDQVPRQIGRRAAELYLERVGTPAPRSPPRQVRLPASLVRRASEARRA